MDTIDNQLKSIEELFKMIMVGDIAMFATHTTKGELRSRPMETCHVTENGDIYFFITIDSPLADELTEHNQVNLNFMNNNSHDYISVFGVVELTRESDEIHRYWNDKYERWIPGGIDAPNLALLMVKPLHAEHWGRSGALENIARLMMYGHSDPKAIYEQLRH